MWNQINFSNVNHFESFLGWRKCCVTLLFSCRHCLAKSIFVKTSSVCFERHKHYKKSPEDFRHLSNISWTIYLKKKKPDELRMLNVIQYFKDHLIKNKGFKKKKTRTRQAVEFIDFYFSQGSFTFAPDIFCSRVKFKLTFQLVIPAIINHEEWQRERCCRRRRQRNETSYINDGETSSYVILNLWRKFMSWRHWEQMRCFRLV